MGKVKILIADGHTMVREGTRQILGQEVDLDVIAEASDDEKAARLARDLKTAVVIINIAILKPGSIETAK